MKRGIILTPPLWRTLKALLELGEATADDLSKKTGRPRTIESRYLSELNRLGIIARRRISRRVFYIEAYRAVRKAVEEFGSSLTVEQIAHLISLPADNVKIIYDVIMKESVKESSGETKQ